MLETFEYVSEPFGFCSHAQYYPENVAKALLHEVTQTVCLDVSNAETHRDVVDWPNGDARRTRRLRRSILYAYDRHEDETAHFELYRTVLSRA